MAKRIEMFYGDYDMKVFPGKKHPDRCDKEKWGTKNFVLEAALSSPNIFFGVDFCEKSEAEEGATGASAQLRKKSKLVCVDTWLAPPLHIRRSRARNDSSKRMG